MMNESVSHEIGKHNLTPIEAMVINMHLPFGTKLELESNFKKSRIPKLRKRKILYNVLSKHSKPNKLKYEGKTLQPPYITTFSRCLLALKKILNNQHSIPFRNNQSANIPSLSTIENKLVTKQFQSFYEFKKALRQLWLYYYINFEKRQDVIQQVSILSVLSEDLLSEIEVMPEEKVVALLHHEDNSIVNNNNKINELSPYEQRPYINNNINNININNNNDRLSQKSIGSNQIMPSSNMLNKKIVIYKEMSIEDKFKLNQKVNQLDQRQLMGIIPLLSNNNDNQQMEYFEFDIDNLSALQLNKLQKYVNDCLAENSRPIDSRLANYNTINMNHSSNVNMNMNMNSNINSNMPNYFFPKDNNIQPLVSSNNVMQTSYLPIPPSPSPYTNYQYQQIQTPTPTPTPNIKQIAPFIEEIHNKSSDDSGSFDYH